LNDELDSSPDYEKDKEKALALAKQWVNQDPIYLDTETTGLDETAEVVELGIVDYDGTVLFDELIQPVGPVGEEARKIHGISEDQLKEAPTWPQVHDEICDIVADRVVVIYNYPFDTRIIDQTMAYHWFLNNSIDWPKNRCAMRLFAQYQGSWNDFFGNYSRHKLSHAAKLLNIEFDNQHRAVTDADVTRQVLERLAEIHDNPNMEQEMTSGHLDNSDNIPEGWLA
jgi:DNA polymerase-3 subunit epsilon